MFDRLKKKMIIYFVLLAVVLSAAFLAQSCELYATGQENDSSVNVNDAYEKCIAITFDDGPHGKDTELLLDELKKRNVRATFFLIGENIEQSEKNRELVKRMYDEGHLIGNHTYSHINIETTGMNSALAEIERTNAIISGITGSTVTYIRPPYGLYDDSLLDRISMTPVLWTIDPDDWDTADVSLIVKRVVNSAANRGIILLHDCYDTSVAAAVEIIDRLSARGYHFVTVDEILLE
jgi:peptidoglycan/xylan/chitin deacetylase (PgdA/CDA1 family)